MTILLMRLGPIARTSAMRSHPISNVLEPRPRLYTHAFDARIEVWSSPAIFLLERPSVAAIDLDQGWERAHCKRSVRSACR